MYSENPMRLQQEVQLPKNVRRKQNIKSKEKSLQCPLKGPHLEQATATLWHFDSMSFDRWSIPNLSKKKKKKKCELEGNLSQIFILRVNKFYLDFSCCQNNFFSIS